MAGGLIDELFVALGFKIDDKGLKQFDKQISSFAKNIGKLAEKMGANVNWEALKKVDDEIQKTIMTVTKLVGATALAILAIDKMAMSLLKNNQAFISFNQQTGLALGNVQRIAQAGMLANMNITPEMVMQSMQAVQSNLAQIRLGQGNIEPYQLLGISPVGKDANQVFDDLRNSIKGLDDMTATNIIQQMGFNPEMITVLRMTNDELADMNGLMLSPEQRQAMEQYGSALRKVQMELGLLKDKALLAIMPSLIKFLKGFEAIAQATFDITQGFNKLLNLIPQLKGVLAAFALAVIAAFNPVIAAITSLYLIIEDLAVWKAGGKSAIGTLVGDLGDGGGKFAPGTMVGNAGASFGAGIGDWLMDKVGVKGHGEQLQKMIQNAQKGMSYDEALKNSTQPQSNLNDKESLIDNTTKISSGGTSAQISHAQNMTQTNYMSFGSPEAVPIAQKANDLMFAMMQVDRTA